MNSDRVVPGHGEYGRAAETRGSARRSGSPIPSPSPGERDSRPGTIDSHRLSLGQAVRVGLNVRDVVPDDQRENCQEKVRRGIEREGAHQTSTSLAAAREAVDRARRDLRSIVRGAGEGGKVEDGTQRSDNRRRVSGANPERKGICSMSCTCSLARGGPPSNCFIREIGASWRRQMRLPGALRMARGG